MLAHIYRGWFRALFVIALLLAAGATTSGSVGAAFSTAHLQITAINSSGAAIGGACYNVFMQNGNGTPGNYIAGACDDGDGSFDGKTTVTGLPTGNVIVSQSIAPSGYALAAPAIIHVTIGKTTHLTMTSPTSGNTLIVTNKNPTGTVKLKGACYSIFVAFSGGSQYVTALCDGTISPLDGVTTFTGLPGKSYTISEYQAPAGYVAGAPKAVTFSSTPSTLKVTMVSEPANDPANVIFNVADSHGNPIANACFNLYLTDSNHNLIQYAGYHGCTNSSGRLVFGQVTSRSYAVQNYAVPSGFSVIPSFVFTKIHGKLKTVNLTLATGGANLSIRTVSLSSGKTITGACWVAYTNNNGRNGTFIASSCDADAPGLDGWTVMHAMPNGSFLIHEWAVPSGFVDPGVKLITISNGQPVSITVKQSKPSVNTAAVKPSPTATKTKTKIATPTATATPVPTIAPTVAPSPTATATAVPTTAASPVSEPVEAPVETPAPTEAPGGATPIAAG